MLYQSLSEIDFQLDDCVRVPPPRRVVLTTPTYFDVAYVINPHMAHHVGTVDHDAAERQWEALRDAVHERDMRLVMDLVVNHTSDEHEWFRRSRDPDSEYHDWYHWVEGDPDEPPNNWTSGFGGSAWAYDDEVGKWYLHLFDEKQPDLNWRNPDVREAIFDMMNWWFERGIDGFRMDVVNLLSKPEGYPDGDPDEEWVGIEHFTEGPRIHEYLGAMDDRVLSGRDAFVVAECIGVDPGEADRYAEHGLRMTINFDHVILDYDAEEVSFRRAHAERGATDLALHDDIATDVDLLKFTPGMDPAYFDVAAGKSGLVVEGTGLGHVNTDLVGRIADLVDGGTHVVMTSQCLEGRVCDRVYDTGRDLLDAGVVEGEDMLPGTAQVKLMWVLANRDADDEEAVARAMRTPLAGEITEQSRPWT